MTGTSKATPRPWRVVTGAITIAAGRHRVRIAADQEAMADAIATKKETALTRAALIVQAVNAHEGLIEALRKARGRIEELGIGYHVEVNHDGPWESCPLTCQTERNAIAKIDRALAAAEGKGE